MPKAGASEAREKWWTGIVGTSTKWKHFTRMIDVVQWMMTWRYITCKQALLNIWKNIWKIIEFIYWNFSAKIQWRDIHLRLQSFQRLELFIWWLILKICWLSGCCENLWCSLRVSLCIWQLQNEWHSLHYFWLGVLCAVHRCHGGGTCNALPNVKKR